MLVSREPVTNGCRPKAAVVKIASTTRRPRSLKRGEVIELATDASASRSA